MIRKHVGVDACAYPSSIWQRTNGDLIVAMALCVLVMYGHCLNLRFILHFSERLDGFGTVTECILRSRV
jgi:hypothetical protein